MTLRSLKFVILLSSIALPAFLTAQVSSNSSEEERLERLMADSAQWYVPRTRVSIGFRMLSDGGKVTFGNLGSVAFDATIAPLSDGIVDRVYDNGAVHPDAPRLDEKDTNGNQTTTPGGRYPAYTTVNTLDDAGNVIGSQQVQTGDFLAYTPGLTRSWGYGAASQITSDGRIGMSTYSAVSEGGSAFKENGMSSGVEFQYSRILSNPTKRLQWGILGGVTLSGINSKTAGSVTSTLLTRTDYYSLNGATLPQAPYAAPSFDDYLSDAGEILRTDGRETTVPISQLPTGPTVATTTAHGITVDGIWQVKGAYFMMRVGPTIRTQLTNRFGINASAGYAGAYAGTVYSVRETFEVPDLDGVVVGAVVGENGDGIEQTSSSKFLSGYYADLNLEWSATERTGLFGGVTAQKFDGYDQMVGSRTARIDLGSSVGLRGGVTIKF